MMKRFFEDLAEQRCPFCGRHVDVAVPVERCVYLEPCGHRLGNADADALNRIWQESQ